MSVLKSSLKSMENSVFELLNTTFPDDFKVSLTDIKFPKKEFVIPFYTFMLEQLQISPHKVMQKPLENQLRNEKHPEIYTEIQQLVNLSQVLRCILTKFSNPGDIQFGLDDLLEPNSTRTSFFMFTLLNFFNFADSRVNELNKKLEIIAERKAQLLKLLDTREKLSREVNQRAISKSKRLDMSKEIKVKRGEIEDLKKESQSLELVSEKKQSELDDARRHLSRVKEEMAELRKTYQKLEAQQVQSPEALQQSLKHLEEKVKETKEQLEQAQETAKEKKKAIKLFQTSEKNQEVRLGLLNDIVAVAKTVKKLEIELVDCQSQIKSDQNELEALVMHLKDVKEELSQRSVQLTNLQLQWEKQKSSMKENIRHLSEEKKTLDKKQSSEIGNVLQNIEDVQAELNDLYEENSRLNKYYEELYSQLNQLEQEFITSKLAEIEAFDTDVDQVRQI